MKSFGLILTCKWTTQILFENLGFHIQDKKIGKYGRRYSCLSRSSSPRQQLGWAARRSSQQGPQEPKGVMVNQESLGAWGRTSLEKYFLAVCEVLFLLLLRVEIKMTYVDTKDEDLREKRPHPEGQSGKPALVDLANVWGVEQDGQGKGKNHWQFLSRRVSRTVESKILPYFQDKKLACHSFMDVGKIYKAIGPETKDFNWEHNKQHEHQHICINSCSKVPQHNVNGALKETCTWRGLHYRKGTLTLGSMNLL